MNKNILLTIMAMAALVLGCGEEESAGVSRVTYYPEITLNGDPQYVLSQGDAFSDPGGVATEDGSEIPLVTTYAGTYFAGTSSTLDTSVPDIYTASYTATNKDGFPGTATRTVFVTPPTGDLVTSIEGVYTSTVVRNGVAAAQYTDMEYVLIRKTGANTYAISDAIGGYYDLGRAYGPTYAATGVIITANDIPSNDFSATADFPVGVFGDVANIESITVDPDAKQIHIITQWATTTDYTFDITLTQVQ